jgi:hypothetical protein
VKRKGTGKEEGGDADGRHQSTAAQARLSIHRIFTMALRPLRLRSCSLIGNVEDPAVCAITPLCAASRLLHSKAQGSSYVCTPHVHLFVLVSTFLPFLAFLFAVWELDIVEDRALTEFQ